MTIPKLLTRMWQIIFIGLGLAVGFGRRLLDLAQAAADEGIRIGRGR